MAEKEEEIVETEEEGTVVADVTPEDILGALDDDVIPADDIEGDDEPEYDETPIEDTEEVDTWEEQEQVAPETTEELEPDTPEAPDTTEDGMVPAKVMHQGKEYEVMVTPEAAKAIEAQQTTAQQLPHLQGKYDQLKEQVEGLTTLPGTTADQDGQPKFSQEEFEKSMQPRVAQAVESGTITEGFAKEFSAETAYGVWMFDAIQKMAGTLHKVSSSIVHDEKTAELERFTQGVYGEMGNMATANPQVFGDLAEQPNREAFFEFVVEKNPTIGQLTGDQAKDTIEGLYAWYKKDQMAAGVHAAQARAKAEQDDARLKAGGAGGGGGARSKPKSRHPDIDAILGD